MKRICTAGLLAAMTFAVSPALAQDGQPLADEAATDIEVVNGVPVNPELRELLSQSDEKRTMEELIAASNDLLAQQQAQLTEQALEADKEWLDDPFNHLESEMTDLVNHFEDGQTDQAVQDDGEKLVAQMGQLITLLEEMQSS